MYRLLIVDDEARYSQGNGQGDSLGELGFEVAGQAGDGEEAVRLLETAKPV